MKQQPRLPELSGSQLEVMNAVWDLGQCTVADVWKSLQRQRQLARNTVHTLMTRLTEKGWLKVLDNKEGGFVYEAAESRESSQQKALQSIVTNVFKGSAEGLVLTLLNSSEVSTSELERIKQLIAQAKRKKS